MSLTSITVQTLVHIPAEKAWMLWTLPEHIVKWNFASDDWETTRAENDVRVGGRFKMAMYAKDGSVGFDFTGTYTVVVPNERLEYMMDDERKVTVDFQKVGDTTNIIEIFEPEQQNPEEMQRGGWQAILNNFKKYAESVSW